MLSILLQAASSRKRIQINGVRASNGQTIGTCTASSGARVRSGPATSYSIVTSVLSGATVVITGEQNNWWKVSANGQSGFMAGFLLSVPAKTTANLNIRNGPGKEFGTVGLYNAGTSINVIDISNGWYKTNRGYVFAQYVKLNEGSGPTPPGPGPTPKPGETFKMIDVSVYQGNIDFNKVKASGINHVIIRTGYGSENPNQIDKKFAQNMDRAIAAGMIVGVYHYGYAKNPAHAEREANFCLKIIRPYKKFIKFPVCYDIEDPAMATGRDNVANVMIAFANKVRAEGYIPWLYSMTSWCKNNNNINMDKIYANNIDLWIAQYNYKCTYYGPKAAWQYSSTQRVPGIVGDVDMSYVFKNY